MARLSKEEQARRDGFDYFVRIYKKQKIRIPEIDEEIKKRGLVGKPIGLDKTAERDFVNRLRYNCLDTITIMALYVLHDKFGFGYTRLKRFQENFNLTAESLTEDYVSWGDIREVLKKETGIETKIRWNGEPVKDEPMTD